MITQRSRRLLVISGFAVLITASCSSGTAGSNSPSALAPAPEAASADVSAIYCDELANFIVQNATLANREALEPLLAELVSCVSLTPDEAADLLNSSALSQTEINAALSNFGV